MVQEYGRLCGDVGLVGFFARLTVWSALRFAADKIGRLVINAPTRVFMRVSSKGKIRGPTIW